MMKFLSMGGYAFYVWGAYGVMALVLLIEVLSLRRKRRAVLEEARLSGPDEPPTNATTGAAR